MSNQRIVDMINKQDAVKKDILGKVGFYSEKICMHPQNADIIAQEMARLLGEEAPDLVVGVMPQSIIPAYELAKHYAVPCIYTQEKNNTMTISRDFSINRGKALIVIDWVDTGKSVRDTVEALRALGVGILAIVCIFDGSGGTVKFRFPFYALCTDGQA